MKNCVGENMLTAVFPSTRLRLQLLAVVWCFIALFNRIYGELKHQLYPEHDSFSSAVENRIAVKL